MLDVYKKAFQEVYVILNNLEQNAYDRIPNEVIRAIENGRNAKYNFKLNDKLPLAQDILLPETKAILYNLYRDYLAEPKQKEKIIKIQEQERARIEFDKIKKYNPNVFHIDRRELRRR